MLAMVGGNGNGRQKTRNHGCNVIMGKSYLLITRSPSQTCHAKPKTQINRRRTLQLLSRWWDACRKQLAARLLRVRTALQQIKERGALPMIDRGDIRQAIDRCSNI